MKRERKTDWNCVAPTPDNAAALGMSGFWIRQVNHKGRSSIVDVGLVDRRLNTLKTLIIQGMSGKNLTHPRDVRE